MADDPRGWDDLRRAIRGELVLDRAGRERYAADESICWIVPEAVVVAKSSDDIRAVVAHAAARKIPITLRAGGSSLAGQAVGPGIVLDVSVNFEGILSIDPKEGSVRAEPGVVLSRLNDALAPHGKRFGPDPSSMDSCRVGGMVANNASGVHHLLWGATVDNVLSLTLLLSNGEIIRTAPVELASEEYRTRCRGDTREARLYREVPELITSVGQQMDESWPAVEKSSSGYRLDKALSRGVLDLGKLVCGSEGTLAIVLEATLRVVDRPRAKGLLLLYFASLEDAARGVKELLTTGPSAVEMIDERVVDLVRGRHPEQAGRFVEGTKGVLFVEYVGSDVQDVQRRMLAGWRRLREEIGLAVADQATTDPGTMEELWRIRRGVEPMLSEMAGRRVPVGFVEDTAVPVERLAEHLRGLYKIFDAHGVQAAAYGHASLGHLHVRPFLDLTDPVDRRHMQQIAAEVFEHTKQLRGTMSAEHGDGLLRTEFLPDFYGRAYEAMVAVKRLFDPEGILNPGKKTGAEAGEMIRHLRPRGVAP